MTDADKKLAEEVWWEAFDALGYGLDPYDVTEDTKPEEIIAAALARRYQEGLEAARNVARRAFYDRALAESKEGEGV